MQKYFFYTITGILENVNLNYHNNNTKNDQKKKTEKFERTRVGNKEENIFGEINMQYKIVSYQQNSEINKIIK